MKYIFWFCWLLDAGVAAWWVLSDLNLTYIRPNPYSYVFLFYVIAALLIYLMSSYTKVAMIMSIIPAIPMLIMGLIIIIVTLTGGRWN
jgi:hypothetical protein